MQFKTTGLWQIDSPGPTMHDGVHRDFIVKLVNFSYNLKSFVLSLTQLNILMMLGASLCVK